MYDSTIYIYHTDDNKCHAHHIAVDQKGTVSCYIILKNQ